MGAAIAAAGAAYQTLFRNPLVSPDILGVSTGAGLGAVLGIFLSLPVAGIQLAAFVIGLATVGLVYAIASLVRGREPILVLVLAGVVVGSLAARPSRCMKILADPYDQLPAIVFWLLGSLSAIRKGEVWTAVPLVLIGLVPLVLLRWRINVLSLGDEEAKALGVEAGRLRLVVIAAATLMTASVVAISGVIGWVGLVIPHIARMRGARASTACCRPPCCSARAICCSSTRWPAPWRASRCRSASSPPSSARRSSCGCWRGAARAGHEPSAPPCWPRRLGFGYGAKVVGRDVDLEVRPGEVLCLLGPNGSGKTTLFKTMLGLLPPRRARCCSMAAARQWRAPQIARRVAYVPQAHAAHFPFRVLDMVVMGRTAHLGLFASPTREDRAKALEALDALGIADLAETEYTRISGGQRQLALVARALAQDAPAIVMDEPTASLDFGNQVVVLGEVRRLAARGLAVVLSTHDPDMPSASATAWRCWMADGWWPRGCRPRC